MHKHLRLLLPSDLTLTGIPKSTPPKSGCGHQGGVIFLNILIVFVIMLFV